MVQILDKLTALLIFLGFSFFLLFPKGGSIILAILVLSLIGLFLKRNTKKNLEKWEKILIIGFVSYFLIVFINNLFFHGGIREIDSASRFILVIPIYFYLRKSNVSHKSLEYGVLFACALFGINSVLPFFFDSNQLFQFSKHPGIVSLYGGILGLSALFLLSNKRILSYNLIVLFCSILAITTSVIALGRGVWIAFFCSFSIMFYLNPLKWSKRVRILILNLVIILSLAAYYLPGFNVKAKIDKALNGFVVYFKDHKATGSVGARLEMWRSSFFIIKDNPIFGIGEGNFKEKNMELINKGLIKADIAKFNHPHGEFVTTTLEQGLTGLGALLFLLFSPLIKCYREFKYENTNTNSNIPLVITLSLVLHYIFYSMSNGVFDHQNTTLFYVSYVMIGMGLFSSLKDKV